MRMQRLKQLEEKHPELKAEAEQVVAALISQLPLKDDGETADEDAVEQMHAALAETRKAAREVLCSMTEDSPERQHAGLKLAAARLTSMQFSTKFPPSAKEGGSPNWGHRHGHRHHHGHLKHALHKIGHMVGKGVHHFVNHERRRGRCGGGRKPPAPASAPTILKSQS